MLGIRRRHTGFAPVLPVLLVTAGITPMAAAHAVAATAPPVSGPTRASVASGGGDADGVSDQTALSGNGRYVAFRSDATNLVAGDTNGVGDVFVRDLRRNTTTLVSVGRHRAPADGASSEPAISRNGQFVAFTSEATNLVRNDTNGVADVFVRDLQTGRTERVSVAGRHQQLTFASAQPDISSNGKFVAFVIRSSTDSNPDESVAVRDRFQHKTTVEDSGPAACPIAGSPRTVRSPSLGANGRYLAFAISCLASTVNRVLELDRPSGTWTEIATMMPPYTAYGEFTWTRYSADANTLAWTSLVASLREFRAGLHVHERVARYLPPNFASTSVAVRRPDLSGDGRFLAYAGGYGNSANGASLLDNAVHVMDRADDSIVEASAPTVDTQRVAGYASEPAIDDSGAIVGFSTEEALVSG
ncbi:MAG: domain protein beta Propeller, partial [Actinomycetia bacterium]|nr:domain protein beta Propeller [Actinomycetes bacterium]